MSTHAIKPIRYLVLFGVFSSAKAYSYLENDHNAIKLHWVPSNSIRKGYYQEPEVISSHKAPLQKPNEAETTIDSDAPVFLQKNNWSTFSGPIVVSQPGRLVKADKAHVYQNPETTQVSTLKLEGNVHFYEPGKHLVSRQAEFNLEKKTGTLNDSVYRIYTKTPTGFQNATGDAAQIIRPNEEVLIIENGSYSTCSPINKTWEMKAQKMVLNQKTQWGTAKKIRLYFKKKKVFSFPYFTFPLSKERKSGFLYPSVGYSDKKLGGFVSIPYYFNLAPNYDETFTFTPNTKRALMLESQFRYLTAKSRGNFTVELLPYDPAFKEFIKNSVPSDFTGVNRKYIDASVNRLKNDHPTRAYLHFDDATQINTHWKTDLHLNYVTDDYYFQDISGRYTPQNTDQLLNRFALQYADAHWDFLGVLQAYQTLHPANQPLINNIYKRIPQLALNGNWFDPKTLLEYQLQTELVHFQFDEFGRHFFPFNDRQEAFPTGNRFHLAPGVTWNKLFAYGFLKPSIQLDMTAYDLDRHLIRQFGSDWQPNGFLEKESINRTLPIANIDAGLYFDRPVSFLKTPYVQTLEPRLFYLYVPYHNQGNIPTFDTVLPPFGFSQLFRTNRFVGIDRISNANQLSLGITSRLLDAINGTEKLQLNLGQIFYFQPPRVFLDGQQYNLSNPSILGLLNPQQSPFVQELIYQLNPQWDLTLNTTWNWRPSHRDQALLLDEYNQRRRERILFESGILPPDSMRWKQKSLNNALIEFAYRPKEDAVFNVGWQFIGNINYYQVDRRNVNRLKLSASYPLNPRWNLLGSWYYNVQPGYTQNALAGIEYNECCWAIRFVFNRELTSQGQNSYRMDRTYSSQFFIQLQLKGLGNFGQTGTETLLTRNIHGYQNQFFGE